MSSASFLQQYELDAVYLNGVKQQITGDRLTVKDITGDLAIEATFKLTERETACSCLWERLFDGCAICEPLGRCVAPWCALAPLLALLVAAAIWLILKRRRAE